MKKRPPPSCNAKRQKAYRERLKQHQLVALVPVNEAMVNFVIRTGWLSERDACKREQIGAAIARLLSDAAQHLP
jgi:hypothetical protein